MRSLRALWASASVVRSLGSCTTRPKDLQIPLKDLRRPAVTRHARPSGGPSKVLQSPCLPKPASHYKACTCRSANPRVYYTTWEDMAERELKKEPVVLQRQGTRSYNSWIVVGVIGAGWTSKMQCILRSRSLQCSGHTWK